MLEKAPHTISNWRTRWDSFTIVLPNWTLRIPDHPYAGNDPDGFIDKAELIKHFEGFIKSFNPDIRFNCEVTALMRDADDEFFTVATNLGEMHAKNIVAAVGTFQTRHIPDLAKAISPKIIQIHTDAYRNPDALKKGAVLIVGSGQSGAQIAEELNEAGRKCYLSTGRSKRFPRHYRGKDGIWWFSEMGGMDATAESLDDSRMRFGSNPILSGKDGGRDLNLHRFARDGIQLLGHLKGAEGAHIDFEPDLFENLEFQDNFIREFKKNIDGFIEKKGLDAPPAIDEESLQDGFHPPVIEGLNLEQAGITSIIWATGYRFDYSWIDFPILDQDKYPITERGVTSVPGLYFLGLQWLWKRKSGLLLGIGEDAKYLAEYMKQQD